MRAVERVRVSVASDSICCLKAPEVVAHSRSSLSTFWDRGLSVSVARSRNCFCWLARVSEDIDLKRSPKSFSSSPRSMRRSSAFSSCVLRLETLAVRVLTSDWSWSRRDCVVLSSSATRLCRARSLSRSVLRLAFWISNWRAASSFWLADSRSARVDSSSDSALAFSSARRMRSRESSSVSSLPRRDIMMNAPMMRAPTMIAVKINAASMI